LSITEMEEARHNLERGAILSALKQGYDQEMVSVASLSGTLALVGRPITRAGLAFSLGLLADLGYVRIWRARELPGFRADRPSDVRPDEIRFAKLLPKGLLLIDGRVEADAMVSFE